MHNGKHGDNSYKVDNRNNKNNNDDSNNNYNYYDKRIMVVELERKFINEIFFTKAKFVMNVDRTCFYTRNIVTIIISYDGNNRSDGIKYLYHYHPIHSYYNNDNVKHGHCNYYHQH